MVLEILRIYDLDELRHTHSVSLKASYQRGQHHWMCIISNNICGLGGFCDIDPL